MQGKTKVKQADYSRNFQTGKGKDDRCAREENHRPSPDAATSTVDTDNEGNLFRNFGIDERGFEVVFLQCGCGGS